MKNVVNDYIDFQKNSPSPFHVVATLKERLSKLSFRELTMTETWNLESGKSYFVVHDSGKSLVSFRVGKKATTEAGFAIIGAHTDSPVLRLKLNPFGNLYGYQVLFNECHGSLILRTWMDRPLVLAGQVYKYKRDKDHKPVFSELGTPVVESKLVASSWPLAVVPELAIHLDREKNELGKINPETMMHTITGCEDKHGARLAIEKALGCGEFDGFELSFAPYWPHCTVGAHHEFIVGPRHDDLAMVYTAQCAMELAGKKEVGARTSVAAFFDAEETGSVTTGGAASFFIEDVLTRIHLAHPENRGKEPVGRSFAKSFVISADLAHAAHPAFPEKHDNLHRPYLNRGLVLKSNSNDRYATSGYGSAVFRALCASVGARVQEFCARGDQGCGSTIGPMISAKLGCETVDVGIAMWGMHSASETIGANDLLPTIQVFEKFYS